MIVIRVVRDATADDACACSAIYAPYVLDTAVTFESEPPDAAEFARRIDAATARHAWLVLEDGGRGTYRRIGWKHGRWHDVAWVQRDLGGDAEAPPGEFT